MRLIDADAFKENILSGLYIYCQENKEDIARAIDDEPTIPVFERERLRSKWLEMPTECSLIYHICPICKNEPLELNDYEYLSNFCPYCGADLREKNCNNCRCSELKLTKEPCYSCIFGACDENINRSDRWESK